MKDSMPYSMTMYGNGVFLKDNDNTPNPKLTHRYRLYRLPKDKKRPGGSSFFSEVVDTLGKPADKSTLPDGELVASATSRTRSSFDRIVAETRKTFGVVRVIHSKKEVVK
jgi:hypothetical protein